MSPRQACLNCLNRDAPALLEAALWMGAEHDPQLQPAEVLLRFNDLQQQVSAGLPCLPASELAQPLVRRLLALGFHAELELLPHPASALLHRVLQRRQGQPLALALIALELAKRLDIPLIGVNFPGHFLLRVPGADHLLDPGSGRRLYPRDCRELLLRNGQPGELRAEHLQPCDATTLLQCLARTLRQLHLHAEDYLAALKDAERVLQLGPPQAEDHLARAEIYDYLDCPQGARFDLQQALLLSNDALQSLHLSQRLRQLQQGPALH